MDVAKIVELSSQSPTSFQDAVQRGITKAAQTLSGIRSAWVKDQEVVVEDGKVTGYRVHLKVTFVLND